MGKAIEPVVRPLGWDWRIGCAAIASFPAREVLVATLGVIYNLGEGQDEESPELQETLRAATWTGTDRPVFNIPVALSVMVFFALCAQCASTLAIMRRETGSWSWPALTFVYMTGLAYVGALITYQVGMWIAS
jgi:ferrous iron transport protein B